MFDFTEDDYTPTLDAIRALAKELTEHVAGLQKAIPHHHHGKKFKAAIVQYAKHINALEAKYDNKIHETAQRITALSTEGWENNPKIITLWYQLAIAITCFSEHPTKKVAALIISKSGALEEYSANRIPSGIGKRAGYYLQNIRKRYIMCAERMALAKRLKLSIDHYKGLSPELRIKLLSDETIKVGEHSVELRNSFMLVTAMSCQECAPAILACHPQAVIVDFHAGKHFTRSHHFEKTELMLERSGIRLIGLKPDNKIS